MRILFIYTDVGIEVGFSNGIGILSAVLKGAGHTTSLIHISDELGYPLDVERIRKDVIAFDPDLVCFSAMTNQYRYVRQVAQGIREVVSVPVICGGHHPTAVPEEVIALPAFDMVCVGEGEHTLLELTRRLEQGQDYRHVPGLWVKENGQVIRNEMWPLEHNLDSLPFEDTELFDYGRIVDTRYGWAEVIVSRGCPYSCSYCFNHSFYNKYKGVEPSLGKRAYLRRRSVDNTLAMLDGLRRRYPNIQRFTFVDDILALPGPWLNEFSARYPKEIGFPFSCTAQPQAFTPRVAQQLKQAGCEVVKMGIEAGNPELRRQVLDRPIKDETLRRAFGLAKAAGLKTQAFNMMGLPTETKEDVLKTIRLNAEIRPYVVWISTFNPFPGTHLHEFCVKHNLLREEGWDNITSYRGDSVLTEDYISATELRQLRIMFKWYLNAFLDTKVSTEYARHIAELEGLSAEAWAEGEAEHIFHQQDAELEERFTAQRQDHYINRRYIYAWWAKEHNFEVT